MAWSAKTQIETAAAVSTTELFSGIVGLNPGELSHVQVVGNSSGVTGNLTISVYTTLDASTENWDTVPIMSFVLDCTDGVDNDVSFVVSGVYRFRLGFVREGASDTITTDAWSRLDGVNL